MSRYRILWLTLLAGLLSFKPIAPGPGIAAFSRGPGRISRLSNRALLDLIQKRTIGYFWNFAEAHSGMAPERTATPDIVTTGGTGFGVACLVVGVYRGWLNRDSVVRRLLKMTRFLARADRFHGAWPHWMHGATGRVKPFSPKDDGGDLVETSYLMEGLLIARQYFQRPDASETALRLQIENLWKSVDWNWYTRSNSGTLYWHWSPDFGWAMNFPIRGFNECLITYILALSSPTHPINPSVYRHTWINSPDFLNGHTYLGYKLDLGFPYGGPLFFTHYSFLGLDPHQMQDPYTFYWKRNLIQTLINHDYCLYQAPKKYRYSAGDWGLTASDEQNGYSAHAPDHDDGTITPSAALSAFPYTPWYSMQALRYFYDSLKSELWGPFGFYDAFSLQDYWFSRQYLAIDEGPIPVMIENYRSGLIWNLFMGIPDIGKGLKRAGIHPPLASTGFIYDVPSHRSGRVDLMKHPGKGSYELDFYLAPRDIPASLGLSGPGGRKIPIPGHQVRSGFRRVFFGRSLQPGPYTAWIHAGTLRDSVRLMLH